MSTEPVKLKPTLLAYLAGIFDGEGCICICRVGPHPPRRPSPAYYIYTTVSMIEPTAIKLFYKYFGGSYKLGKKTPDSRIMYRWAAGEWRAIRVLKTLQRFIRIKRKQVAVAYKFSNTKKRENRGRNILEPHIIRRRDGFYHKMSRLNNSYWIQKRLRARQKN